MEAFWPGHGGIWGQRVKHLSSPSGPSFASFTSLKRPRWGVGGSLGGLGKTGSQSAAATSLLLDKEVGVAILKVHFEGVIPTVGGMGRRQDSQGRTVKCQWGSVSG